MLVKLLIGMFCVEFVGEFMCDVFDSEVYCCVLMMVLEIFVESTVREAFDFIVKSYAGSGLGLYFD